MRKSNINQQVLNSEILNWDPESMETYWEQCDHYDYLETNTNQLQDADLLSRDSFSSMFPNPNLPTRSKQLLFPFKSD